MAATADVDVALLQRSFDTAPYDGFLEPEVYEAVEAAARSALTSKVILGMAMGAALGGLQKQAAWSSPTGGPRAKPRGSKHEG